MMLKSKHINFDNVKPNDKFFSSKQLLFKDKTDLIRNAEKEKNLIFSKKINLFVFLLTISFASFVSFNLLKLSYKKEVSKIVSVDRFQTPRGKILDRNNEIIAASLDTKDLYIDVKNSLNKRKLEKELSDIFLEKSSYLKKIFQKEQYSLIKKDISLSNLNKLKMIGDPAIKLHKSKKRIYPQHNIFSNLIGIKTPHLISKLEKNLNEVLSNGSDVRLTVDLRIQNIVRDELYKSLKYYNAKAALAMVMNVNNGEILAMVSLPDFNPNYPESILPKTEINLTSEARYEMGSTLKIFNAAIVYESKHDIEYQKFNISKGYQITSDKNIVDEHIKKDILNFEEIFIKSSNIGSVKILESLGADLQYKFFDKLGLTQKLKADGLKIVSNKLPNNWESHSKFISYGYGLSISPISLITAFSSMVNGGYKIKPTIVVNKKQSQKVKILSSDTSKKINKLIQKIVNEGTGKKAKVNGILVGGKTGTSKKVESGNYSEKKKVTSFIGVFPANYPEYLTFVLFDEPENNISGSNENTGGNTAAPTFSKIVKKVSPIISKSNYFKD